MTPPTPAQGTIRKTPEIDKLPAPTLVTRPVELRSLAETLSKEAIVAVDTESNSLYAYREQVCLVQFSTAEADIIVDPLALQDLSPLGAIFESPVIEKVFHAVEYDLICLRRDYGFGLANVFDTMIAARILGREAVGLGSMLQSEFGLRLDKRGQRANWGQRPLPQDLLDYARLDTRYLIALRERLVEQLKASGLWPLAEEDFRRAALGIATPGNETPGNERHDDPLENGNKTASCWRIRGAHDLSPQGAAVLQELCEYREEIARRIDRPVFKVLNDQTLVEIAHFAPRSQEELRRLPGMTPIQMRRHGSALLEAVQRGQAAPPLRAPRSPRPDEKFLDRLEELRQWRKLKGQKMGLPSDVILPRDLLFNLAQKAPRTPEELAVLLETVPWRLEHFGAEILSILKKR